MHLQVTNGTTRIRTRTEAHSSDHPTKITANFLLPSPFISVYSQSKGGAVTFKVFSLSQMTWLIQKGQGGTEVAQWHYSCYCKMTGRKNTQIKEKRRSRSGIFTETEQESQYRERVRANWRTPCIWQSWRVQMHSWASLASKGAPNEIQKHLFYFCVN